MNRLPVSLQPREEIDQHLRSEGILRARNLRPDVSDAPNIADMIIRTGEDNPLDPHWVDTAASHTTGMILRACYSAAAQQSRARLFQVEPLGMAGNLISSQPVKARPVQQRGERMYPTRAGAR